MAAIGGSSIQDSPPKNPNGRGVVRLARLTPIARLTPRAPSAGPSGGGILFRVSEPSVFASTRVKLDLRFQRLDRHNDPLDRTVPLDNGKTEWLISDIPDGRYRLTIAFNDQKSSYDLGVEIKAGQPDLRIRVYRYQVAYAPLRPGGTGDGSMRPGSGPPQAPSKSLPAALASDQSPLPPPLPARRVPVLLPKPAPEFGIEIER
jgi:hypothetical protein